MFAETLHENMESSRPRQENLSTAPLDHSTSHGEHRNGGVVVNSRHLTWCPSSTEENIPPFPWWGALAAVVQRAFRALVILSSTFGIKQTLRQTNGWETFLLRAARYSSSLDNEIDHDCILAINTGNSTIYQGVLSSGTRVAIKTIRWAGADPVMVKQTLREVHVWSKLSHDNVVPLLGITTIPNQMVSIVTPWMSQGNAHEYVQDTSVDPRPLILDIVHGLFYLHNHVSGPIIHGDLKGMNVLISAKGRALLTDFGHSRLTNSSFSMTADPPLGGTLNWLAPENVDTGECNSPGDIWAFGMTALELFSRTNPFHDVRGISAVLKRVVLGPLPKRPDDACACSRMTDAWWNMCNLCWERDPLLRPKISELMVMIEQLVSSNV